MVMTEGYLCASNRCKRLSLLKKILFPKNGLLAVRALSKEIPCLLSLQHAQVLQNRKNSLQVQNSKNAPHQSPRSRYSNSRLLARLLRASEDCEIAPMRAALQCRLLQQVKIHIRDDLLFSALFFAPLERRSHGFL